MIGMAISVMWLLVGVVILCAVIWLALYVVQTVLGIGGWHMRTAASSGLLSVR